MTELAVHEDIDHTNGAQVAVRDNTAPAVLEDVAVSPLMLWAYEAKQASQIAGSLARTSFVPASLRSRRPNPEEARAEETANITAAILAGMELGLRPMATMRSIDIVQGTPALRAHAMRGLVQSRGHEVELVESTPKQCVMRGRRKGSDQWQEVTWTFDRAAALGLTSREQWRKQPQTMLIARATGEVCRLIASDVLHAMPYAAEELAQDGRQQDGRLTAPARVTAAEIMRNAQQATQGAAEMPEMPQIGLPVTDPASSCGWCEQPGHHEDECPQREDGDYADTETPDE
jgi:hypothetical protein